MARTVRLRRVSARKHLVELLDFAEALEFDFAPVTYYFDKIRCSSSISAPGAVTFGLWLASSS
jgi:hypothetical protein